MTADRLQALSSWMGGGVAVIGAVVLAGWIFDLEWAKTIYGPITMKTNAAIGLLASGLGVWSLAKGHLRATGMFGSAALIIGAATLSQHLAGWDLGIDQLLFTEAPGAAATASPNRMGPHASTSFVLAGAALLLLRRGTAAAVRAAEPLSYTGLAFSLVAICGYAYGATELFGIARYTGIALHTALALFLLHAGILAAGATAGALAPLVDAGLAGTMVRRLILPVVALPLLIGYLTVLGRQQEILDRGLATSAFAVSVIVILLVTVWHTAAVIRASDHDRQRAREEAERANRLKDQFIAVLSHELRTPLNVMLGRLRLLEHESDREARIRAAGIVARNGRLLARLVEDLLDLSRATAGQFEIARAPALLNMLVRNAADALAPDAAARAVTLAVETDASVGIVDVDAYRIQQVVSNLISNAVKFTPAGGHVLVRTSMRGERADITVTDTGIGFDGEFARQMFQPFRQADPSFRREHGGLGLGLSIARHLMALHGGSIEASSPGPGGGATFVASLPARAAGADRPSADAVDELTPLRPVV